MSDHRTPEENAPNEYEALVSLDKMPPCPLCGKPINVPATKDEDRLMVFQAHGMAALAHDGCRPKEGNRK